MHKDRFKKVWKIISKKNLDGLIITNPVNIHYLTGFKGISEVEREAIVVVNKKSVTIILPKMYEEAFDALKIKGVKKEIIEERHYLFTVLGKIFKKGSKVGVESDNLRLSEYSRIKKNFNGKIIESSDIVETVRITKDKEELKKIKKAVRITDLGFERIKKFIKVGITERQIAKKLEQIFEELGADGISFDTIVANGPSSSLPHYMPENKKIKKGIVLIDAGARFKGYNGDLTRTFYLGKPDKKFIDTYNLVMDSQLKALDATRAGKTEEEVWKVSSDALGKEATYFIHGLGHGVGLDIHESPYLRKDKKMKLQNGMVITIEPGLYYAGWGGIRIEDYIIIEKGKAKILSTASKNLEDMIIS